MIKHFTGVVLYKVSLRPQNEAFMLMYDFIYFLHLIFEKLNIIAFYCADSTLPLGGTLEAVLCSRVLLSMAHVSLCLFK